MITAFVVDSLAYPVILGHDFLKHYRLNIAYSEDPVRISGRDVEAGPPCIPWLMQDALEAVDRGVRSRRCCTSFGEFGTSRDNNSLWSEVSVTSKMTEPESPRLALAATQRLKEEKREKRLEKGLQTEVATKQAEVETEQAVEACRQVQAAKEAEGPKKEMEEKQYVEEQADLGDLGRYCVGCAVAFGHLSPANFDYACEMCAAPLGCCRLESGWTPDDG
ncbi:hypothetical protein FOZ60_012709, partial [Perkinsus olseni]